MDFVIFPAIWFWLLWFFAFQDPGTHADASPDILPFQEIDGYSPFALVVLHSIVDVEPLTGGDLEVRFGLLNNVANDPDSIPVYGYDVSESVIACPIPTFLIVCQTFSDTLGIHPLGLPFTFAPFGTGRFSNTPILVGSILCSDAAAINAYVTSRPPDGNPIVRAVPRPFVAIYLYRAYPTPDLEQTLLVDGSAVKVSLPYDERIAEVTDAGGGVQSTDVSCQLYRDVGGTRPFGLPFTNGSVFYEGPNMLRKREIKSVRCRLKK